VSATALILNVSISQGMTSPAADGPSNVRWNIGKFRVVDFKQVRMMERAGHGVGVDVGRPHIDVTKVGGCRSALAGKETLNLPATGIGSLQPGSEINHLRTIIGIQRVNATDVKIQMIVGHIFANILKCGTP
jgi:hypothetical protein